MLVFARSSAKCSPQSIIQVLERCARGATATETLCATRVRQRSGSSSARRARSGKLLQTSVPDEAIRNANSIAVANYAKLALAVTHTSAISILSWSTRGTVQSATLHGNPWIAPYARSRKHLTSSPKIRDADQEICVRICSHAAPTVTCARVATCTNIRRRLHQLQKSASRVTKR